MKMTRWLANLLAAVTLIAFCSGCYSHSMLRGSAYGPAAPTCPAPAVAPGTSAAAAPAGQVAAVPAKEKSFVDRHPLLAAPRNYFRDSGSNLLVKTFYGTVVGIPVGIAREAWQIVYGQ